jgi:hypothetical protein
MRDFRFQIDGEAVFFEDLSKAAGHTRRIAGVISTETRDRQAEIVIQKGLNFEPFLTYGWFNDNHSKDTDAVIGWPESIKQFQKGMKLPNGQIAKANCTWCEGYMMEGDGSTRADKIWSLTKAIQKSGSPRALGFSIEGSVLKRMGPARKIVAEAVVTNTAITNCPVNTETKLETLAKSLSVVAQMPDDLDRITALEKALTAGTPANPLAHGADAGPMQGEGAGQILIPQDLERDIKFSGATLNEFNKPKRKTKLTKAEAAAWVKTVLPGFRPDQIERLVDATIKLEAQGAL